MLDSQEGSPSQKYTLPRDILRYKNLEIKTLYSDFEGNIVGDHKFTFEGNIIGSGMSVLNLNDKQGRIIIPFHEPRRHVYDKHNSPDIPHPIDKITFTYQLHDLKKHLETRKGQQLANKSLYIPNAKTIESFLGARQGLGIHCAQKDLDVLADSIKRNYNLLLE